MFPCIRLKLRDKRLAGAAHLRQRLPLLRSQVDEKGEIGLNRGDGGEDGGALRVGYGGVNVGVGYGCVWFGF